jgi:hypothetical protein
LSLEIGYNTVIISEIVKGRFHWPFGKKKADYILLETQVSNNNNTQVGGKRKQRQVHEMTDYLATQSVTATQLKISPPPPPSQSQPAASSSHWYDKVQRCD